MSKDLAKQNPQQALMEAMKQDLEKYTGYLETLLPHKGQVTKFKQMALAAALRDPKILQCTPRSFLLAVIWCAQKDLEPGVDDGAWLIPYKGIVVPVPAYKGLIKKAKETESVNDVLPYGIYKNDDFDYGYGLTPFLNHQPPKLGVERGELIGAYVVVIMPDGSKRFHVMDRPEVEKIRNSSAAWASSQSGPWKDWEDSMFRKTVIKQILKYIPVKPAFRDLIHDDNRLDAGASLAALLKESGKDLPEGFPEDETPPGEVPPSGPPPDTSEFDRLVDGLGLDEARRARIEEFVNAIAAAPANKKQGVTPAMVKADAAKGKWEPYEAEVPDPKDKKEKIKVMQPGFRNAFFQWEAGKYPAPPPAAASPPAAGVGQNAGAGPAGPESECFAHGKFQGDDCPVCAQERGVPSSTTGSGEAPPPSHPAPAAAAAGATDPTFAGRCLALWDSIIDKKALDAVATKYGVKQTTDITPENFNEVKWLVDNFTPPKARGGKK